jgi:hypothetical protein
MWHVLSAVRIPFLPSVLLPWTQRTRPKHARRRAHPIRAWGAKACEAEDCVNLPGRNASEAWQDALSLLAYEEPEASPCGELLGAKAREDVAAALSAALLAHSGRSAQSALERCLAQLARADLASLLQVPLSSGSSH